VTEQTGRTSAGLLRIQKSEQLFGWKLLFYLQIMVFYDFPLKNLTY